MFYIMYLTNLCHRRRWPDPQFELGRTRQGYSCRVRVNNREYTSDAVYTTEELAREKAAESAYMICRNFSVNDGMYPGQRQGQPGVTQGLPVAIGTGRRSTGHRYGGGAHASDYSAVAVYGGSGSSYRGSSGSSSGGSSPRTSDSDLETASRRSSSSDDSGHMPPAVLCYCRRDYVQQQHRCGYCIREAAAAWC